MHAKAVRADVPDPLGGGRALITGRNIECAGSINPHWSCGIWPDFGILPMRNIMFPLDGREVSDWHSYVWVGVVGAIGLLLLAMML